MRVSACVGVRARICVCVRARGCGEGKGRGGEKGENSGENTRFVEDEEQCATNDIYDIRIRACRRVLT